MDSPVSAKLDGLELLVKKVRILIEEKSFYPALVLLDCSLNFTKELKKNIFNQEICNELSYTFFQMELSITPNNFPLFILFLENTRTFSKEAKISEEAHII